ncbi:ABC transporter substrate-binding protein [Paenibacillus sp. GCM10012307]|uniref:Extracellular solute-binding protein n=1 Tax=Paenibacillus roseus TaxID=2798579 RepID=A0A934MQI5_9BACL|nr:extracellular solute-binding protein [Paenibacillus roseus]MBJ6363191.1 extracellular solute-binding protein [Paenibacillus roseus]
MRKSFRKTVVVCMSILLLSSMLAACTKGSGGSESENRVLRIGIMYGSKDNESYFRQQYTDTFEVMNQNIEVQIVQANDYNVMYGARGGDEDKQDKPDPYAEFQKLISGDNPVDVVVADPDVMSRLIEENSLKELDPLIQQDKFDIDAYVPTVLEGIKSLSTDNKIYALTPTFTSSALFYNKKLFNQEGIDLPTNGMQWDQVIDLARRFVKPDEDNKVFGLMLNRYSDPFNDALSMAAPLQLQQFDENLDKMLVNSEGWEKIWNKVVGLYRDKITPTNDDMYKIYSENQSNDGKYVPFMDDLFVQGKVAMMIGNSYYLNDLRNAKDQSAEGFEMPDWDVVSLPEHPEAPGIGSSIALSTLMGVNNKAQNPNDAWKFIKFMNSKEWAKLKSRSTYEMVARKEFLKPLDGMTYNVEAFYSLKPTPPSKFNLSDMYSKYPYFYQAVNEPGQQLFQQVLDNKKTVKEALAEWETKGNANLKKMKENPDQPISEDGNAGGGVVSSVY